MTRILVTDVLSILCAGAMTIGHAHAHETMPADGTLYRSAALAPAAAGRRGGIDAVARRDAPREVR